MQDVLVRWWFTEDEGVVTGARAISSLGDKFEVDEETLMEGASLHSQLMFTVQEFYVSREDVRLLYFFLPSGPITDVHQYVDLAEGAADYPQAGESTPTAISYLSNLISTLGCEISDEVRSWLRDTDFNASGFVPGDEFQGNLREELESKMGDLLRAVVHMHHELGLDVGHTLSHNIRKLANGRFENAPTG